jgi:4-carboxymuconolactone decarboxylase
MKGNAFIVTVGLLAFANSAFPQASGSGDQIRITRSGSQPAAAAPPEHFTGVVHVQPVFPVNPPSRTSGGSVTFDPGARSAWHTHPLGQTLIVTAGVGRIQRWGGPLEEMRQGDVVWIPPGQKHWHGATPTAAITHIAIQETLDGRNVDWLEKVSDAQYGADQKKPADASKGVTSAQKAVGDFAPKLAELTDDVLFGEVWERPQLSKRDRSLITCAALVATGKTEQLGFHFPRAIENGVTQQELGELVTHLAFYVGWPNSLSAVARAKEVLGPKQGPGAKAPTEKKTLPPDRR